MPQEFSDEDDLAHIRWLATAFADDRYIKIDGRPLMLIYRPGQLPDPRRTADIWRAEAQRLGFPDLYLCWVESWGPPPGGPEAFGLDASVGFMPPDRRADLRPLRGHPRSPDPRLPSRPTRRRCSRPRPAWKRFPSVMVGWDNTARRPHGATIFTGSTPERTSGGCASPSSRSAGVRQEENYLFIVAWNEWAEGNHLEPDQRYGRAFLEATRAVLLDPPRATGRQARRTPRRLGRRRTRAEDIRLRLPLRARQRRGQRRRPRRGSEPRPAEHRGRPRGRHRRWSAMPLDEAGIAYHGLEIDPVAVELMQRGRHRRHAVRPDRLRRACRPRSTTSATSVP